MYVCFGASSGGLVRWKGKVIRLAPLQNLMWWGSRHWLLLIVIITFRFSVFTVDGSGRRQATGGSRCRWAGQCNDSGRRRSLVLRLHRNPPLGGGHYERLTLSLFFGFLGDELAAQSQAQFVAGFLAFSGYFGYWLGRRTLPHGGLSWMHPTRSQDIGPPRSRSKSHGHLTPDPR